MMLMEGIDCRALQINVSVLGVYCRQLYSDDGDIHMLNAILKESNGNL